MYNVCTVRPLNKGHFGEDINSADLFFVERFSSCEVQNVGIIGIIPDLSFVERFVILRLIWDSSLLKVHCSIQLHRCM